MRLISNNFWLIAVVAAFLFAAFYAYELYQKARYGELTGNGQNASVTAIASRDEDFLKSNKSKPGVTTRDSGLQYKVINELSSGARPNANDVVTVHYVGKFIDGEIFDQSAPTNPATFGLDQVIPGWTEGVQLMRVGEKFEFYIPSDLAYGPLGNPRIPGGSTLIFEVELLKIK